MEHQDISVPAVAGETQCATSAHSFLQTLADRGVSVAFGIPGGTASPLFDALEACAGCATSQIATRRVPPSRRLASRAPPARPRLSSRPRVQA